MFYFNERPTKQPQENTSSFFVVCKQILKGLISYKLKYFVATQLLDNILFLNQRPVSLLETISISFFCICVLRTDGETVANMTAEIGQLRLSYLTHV